MVNRPGYKYLAAKILTIDATHLHDVGRTRELEFLKEIEARRCQDLIHPMYSASLSIVPTCLLYAPLGPDHPWCASGNALTDHCACVSTWWNTVLC